MSNIRPLKTFEFDPDKSDGDLPARSAFYFPGKEQISKTYLCGHSLGLQPVKAATLLDSVMRDWRMLAVDGHFTAEVPWIDYLEDMHGKMSRIVGAREDEIVIMNSLTANIHMLLSGFYRPDKIRRKILIDFPTFPSDVYAVRSHLAVRGFSPEDIILWRCRPEDGFFYTEDLEQLLEEHQDELALVFISGLHYLNGQYFDLERIAGLVHQYPVKLGLDLAHAAGNVPMDLHTWGIDFACWCTYKYLNGGPGSLGACFIHQRHHGDHHHFQGWWGNDIANRFEMEAHFTPASGAASWQLSNPPILSLPSLRASLDLYQEHGMEKIRNKSRVLSAFLFDALSETREKKHFEILTPEDPERRGAMICLRFPKAGKEVFTCLQKNNVIVDYRRPDTIRVSAHPLYNNFEDLYHFVEVLKSALPNN